MKIDEAIKHCEEVAEENEKTALYKPIDFCVTGEIDECIKCAAEHRQLAEWLKNYKRLLEQEPCGDAISRQAVIDTIDKWIKSMHVLITLPANEVTPLFESVHELPSVIPQQKMGKWIYRKEEDSYRCSLCTFPCHKDNMGALPTRYCAECGAKMQEEKEDK